ncbi:MAG: tryptophan synthase subunit alpha [Planctomycetia bacterium]|nr:tryptophan synthase subunit alpha [Planctomycetia bacterium]
MPSGTASIAAVFAANREQQRKALAPFVTAGDPDVDTTVAILEAIDRAGASLCELGVPYSDPIADGAVIQASYTRALDNGMTIEALFATVKRAAAKVRMPILAMASYSIIFRRGIDRFVADAKAAGLAGFVVPDLPVEESDDLDAACRSAGLALVRLVTPTTPPDRAEAIARRSTGFLYCVSVAGVTGARTDLPAGLIDRVKWLRTKTDVPILVGFGISTPEQAKAVAAVADGVIVGSALVRHLAEAGSKPREELVRGVEDYVGKLAAAVGTSC